MIIGILGAGAMGSGIAQVAATAGCEVYLCDNNSAALVQSQEKLKKVMDRLVEKGRIDLDTAEGIQTRIHYAEDIHALNDAALVIEAIVEDLQVKQRVFAELEPHVSPHTTLASNTSSLSLAALASSLQAPHRFLGLHFFNPAPLMKLVEVIPAVQSDPQLVSSTIGLMESWGKTAVLAKDTPGFIVNKVARPFYGEALRIYDEGIADVATIDWAMKQLGNFRMGPFELMDFIGHDVNYAVTESVFKAFYYDSRYRPSFTQKRLVEAGYLGKKSGKGFYTYPNQEPDPNPDPDFAREILRRIVLMLINEAADTLHMGVASMEDIELAMTQGVNYPKGLFAWADEWGVKECVAGLDTLYAQYHEDRYRCSPILRLMAQENRSFYPERIVKNG